MTIITKVMRQSRSRQTDKSGGNAGDRVTIGFCLGSDWFRGWREFSRPITDLGKAPANNPGLLPTLNWKFLYTRFFYIEIYGLVWYSWQSNHVVTLTVFAIYSSPRARSCGRCDKSDEAYVLPAGRVSERKFPVVYLSRPWNARTLPLVLLLQCELFSQAGSKISLFLDWFEE